MSNQNLTTTANNAKSAVTNAFSRDGVLSFGGISLPELAVLGAAGFVIWKNRSQIEAILKKGGLEMPSMLTGDMNELIASSAAFIAKSKKSATAELDNSDRGSEQHADRKETNSFNSTKPVNANAGQLNAAKQDTAKKSSTIHDA